MNLVSFTSDLRFEENLALSAINENPNVKWAKFIFTDDQPNGNRQRIPLDEFPNVLKTGHYMPIKMASGKILDGHDYSEPIGVITNLKQEDNKILGLAAFWTAEREKDINLLETMTANGNNPQLSWELWFDDKIQEPNDVEALHGVVVRASTIVGKPAYKGRTPILAMSSEDVNTEAQMELEEKIKQLEEMLLLMKDEHEQEISKLKEELHKTKCDLESSTSELITLRTFKSEVDKIKEEVARVEAEESKLKEIKDKFVSAGIAKDESYFNENREKFLKMDESTLDFILQELVNTAKSAQASEVKVPNIVGEEPITTNPKLLAKLLLERNIK